jgi:hypothetical protein
MSAHFDVIVAGGEYNHYASVHGHSNDLSEIVSPINRRRHWASPKVGIVYDQAIH